MTERHSQIAWQTAVIVEVVQRTPSIKSFLVKPSVPFAHIAGQHIDVRLTAPDGYSAMRSYSIASAPVPSGIVELAIERLDGGEVSEFFHDVAEAGDRIEIRGPLGGHFLWPGLNGEPVLLIGAGSGVVPLLAMIRHRRLMAQSMPTALLLSARTAEDVLYAQELHAVAHEDQSFVLALALTRGASPDASDFARRVDDAMVKEVVDCLPRSPEHVFVCGSNGFVNTAVDGTLAAGIPASKIRTERYGG